MGGNLVNNRVFRTFLYFSSSSTKPETNHTLLSAV